MPRALAHIRSWCLLLFLLSLGAQDLIAQEKITYFHGDVQGSPVAATDPNANVVWREDYAPYGERRNYAASADSHATWFGGHAVNDDTGISYMGARHYDPVVGRFYGMDPAVYTSTQSACGFVMVDYVFML